MTAQSVLHPSFSEFTEALQSEYGVTETLKILRTAEEFVLTPRLIHGHRIHRLHLATSRVRRLLRMLIKDYRVLCLMDTDARNEAFADQRARLYFLIRSGWLFYRQFQHLEHASRDAYQSAQENLRHLDWRIPAAGEGAANLNYGDAAAAGKTGLQ